MYIVFYLRRKMSNVLLRNDAKTCRRCCRIVMYVLPGALNKFSFCSKFVTAIDVYIGNVLCPIRPRRGSKGGGLREHTPPQNT